MKKLHKHLSFVMAAVLTVMTCFQSGSVKAVKAETTSTKQMETIASFDFEGNDTMGWGPRGTESAAVTTDEAHTGSQSVLISDRTKTWHGVSCDVTDYMEDGKNYTFKIWVKYTNSNYGGTQQMMLSVATTTDGTESYTNLTKKNVTCGNWTLFEGTYTYSSAVDTVKVYMEGGTFDFYADDCSIETMATSETVLSQNFEEELGGWGARGSETVALSTEASHAGSQSAKISDRTASWNGLQKDITSLLTDGKSYTFKMYVMYNGEDAEDTQDMHLSVQTTLDGTDSYTNLASKTVNKGEWTLLKGSFVYNADSAEAVKLYVEGGTQDFYVDDVLVTVEKDPEIQDLQSIKDTYANYCKFGTAATANELSATEKAIIKKHFNTLTVGNEMKPDSMLDYNKTVALMEKTGDQTTPVVTLSKAAPLLKFAQQNHLAVRGHCLVWHSQTPRWFFAENFSQEQSAPLVSKEVMLQRMENYIKAVFQICEEQYPDVEFYTWDVVNEAVDPNQSNGLRAPGTQANQSTSLWMQTIGSDFIEKAFEYARKYAPEGTVLAYNDYNECDSNKMPIIYNLCKDLVDKGLLDAIGMQEHHSVSYPSVSMFETAVRKYASLGVKVQITEFDMTTYDSSANGMETQGKKYRQFFDKMKALMDEGINIDSITIWGVSDATSWRASQYPLIFDADFNAKPAFYGVIGDTKLPTETPATSEAPATTSAPVVTSEAPATTSVPVVTSEAPATTTVPAVTTETPVTSAAPSNVYPVVSVKTSIGSNLSQSYTITKGGTGAIDISKIKIVYNYTKDGSSEQSFWCDSAGLQMPVAPYYVSYASNVKGTFGEKGLTMTFDKSYDLNEGSLSLQIRFNNADWSAYTNFVSGSVDVYYDGQLVQTIE